MNTIINKANKNKIALAYGAFALLIALPGLAAAQTAPATTDDSATSAIAPAPATTDDSATSATASTPATTDSSATSAATPVPVTTGTSATSAGSSAPSTTGVSVTTAGPTISASVSSSGSGSVSGGGSFTSSSFSSSSAAPLVGVLLPAPIANPLATASCPLIASPILKVGIADDPGDVAKLQAFLQNTEGLDVAVTGTFDAQTEAAVAAFQTKYLSDIMGPWGATQASGVAYITTLKKINQIACAEPLTLTPSESAVIAAYKADATVPASANGSSTAGANAPLISAPLNASTTPLSPDVGQTSDQNANVAAVGGASILSKFWSFLKSIF